mmetsp:Transcript_41408/g.49676  ORF Transcript_41408/g.49676 Transcript_41408/m.49676 type:complete len:89 (+) Transcript_41408:197-463(+)
MILYLLLFKAKPIDQLNPHQFEALVSKTTLVNFHICKNRPDKFVGSIISQSTTKSSQTHTNEHGVSKVVTYLQVAVHVSLKNEIIHSI